jgi:hypothetical protein
MGGALAPIAAELPVPRTTGRNLSAGLRDGSIAHGAPL